MVMGELYITLLQPGMETYSVCVCVCVCVDVCVSMCVCRCVFRERSSVVVSSSSAASLSPPLPPLCTVARSMCQRDCVSSPRLLSVSLVTTTNPALATIAKLTYHHTSPHSHRVAYTSTSTLHTTQCVPPTLHTH